MTMRYLTGEYVDWLGLQTVPLQMPRSAAIHSIMRFTDTTPALARPDDRTYVVGVLHDGRAYQRDGLGWTLTDYWHAEQDIR